MLSGMEQIYKFYIFSKKNFLEKYRGDFKWENLYKDLDNEVFDINEYQRRYQSILINQGKESVEYKDFSKEVHLEYNRFYDIYVKSKSFTDLLNSRGINFDADDIDIWNLSIKQSEQACRHIGMFKRICLDPIKHIGICKDCGGKWTSDKKITTEQCGACSQWEVIFEMYEIAYERDPKFIEVLESIKELVYSQQFYTPKSYDFRKKIEDRGIRIDTNIERIWNLANDELGMQNIRKVGRWEYYSPTEKIGKGIKDIFGSLFK